MSEHKEQLRRVLVNLQFTETDENQVPWITSLDPEGESAIYTNEHNLVVRIDDGGWCLYSSEATQALYEYLDKYTKTRGGHLSYYTGDDGEALMGHEAAELKFLLPKWVEFKRFYTDWLEDEPSWALKE